MKKYLLLILFALLLCTPALAKNELKASIGMPNYISLGFKKITPDLDAYAKLYKADGIALEVQKKMADIDILNIPFDGFLEGGILLGAGSVPSTVYPMFGGGLEYKFSTKYFAGIGLLLIPTNINVYIGMNL